MTTAIDLDIPAIEQAIAAHYAPCEIEMFDDLILLGEWAYLFREDRLLVSVHASILAGREDA